MTAVSSRRKPDDRLLRLDAWRAAPSELASEATSPCADSPRAEKRRGSFARARPGRHRAERGRRAGRARRRRRPGWRRGRPELRHQPSIGARAVRGADGARRHRRGCDAPGRDRWRVGPLDRRSIVERARSPVRAPAHLRRRRLGRQLVGRRCGGRFGRGHAAGRLGWSGPGHDPVRHRRGARAAPTIAERGRRSRAGHGRDQWARRSRWFRRARLIGTVRPDDDAGLHERVDRGLERRRLAHAHHPRGEGDRRSRAAPRA